MSHGAIQFTVYEELKALAGRLAVGPQGAPPRGTVQAGQGKGWEGREAGLAMSPATIFLIGAVSKLCASVVTYPSQVQPFSHFRLQARDPTCLHAFCTLTCLLVC